MTLKLFKRPLNGSNVHSIGSSSYSILKPSFSRFFEERVQVMSNINQNKADIRRLCSEVYNAKHFDAFEEIVAPDFVDSTPLSGMGADAESLKHFLNAVQAAFPDNHLAIEHVIAEDDKVAVQWTSYNLHTGEPFLNIPASSNPITITGTTIYRPVEGQLVEMWHNEDTLGLLQQLGMIPVLS
jgi:steroid delta-isomerase-like uncharacterized protein